MVLEDKGVIKLFLDPDQENEQVAARNAID
jgi:hypothetical protein